MDIHVRTIPDFEAEEIRRLRMSLRLTQANFAQIIGVSQKTIESWECGRYIPNPTSRRMLSLLKSDPELLKKIIY